MSRVGAGVLRLAHVQHRHARDVLAGSSRDGRHVEHVGRQDQVDVRCPRAARRGREATRDRGARCRSPPPSSRRDRARASAKSSAGRHHRDVSDEARPGIAASAVLRPGPTRRTPRNRPSGAWRTSVASSAAARSPPTTRTFVVASPCDPRPVQAHASELALDEQADETEREGGREVEPGRIHLERHREHGQDGEHAEGRDDDASVLLPARGPRPGAARLVHLQRQPPHRGKTQRRGRRTTCPGRSPVGRSRGPEPDRPEQCQARAPGRTGRRRAGRGRGVDATSTALAGRRRRRSGWTGATRRARQSNLGHTTRLRTLHPPRMT